MKKATKQLVISVVSYVLIITLVFSLPMFAGAKGSVKSQNDVSLKLRVDWETDYADGNDFVSVTAKVYLEHNSIFVSARNNGSVSINGNSDVFSTPAIKQASETKSETLLAVHTVQIPYKSGETIDADLYAKWYFNGTYSGKKIDWLEVSGQFTFNDSEVNLATVGNNAIPKANAYNIDDVVNNSSNGNAIGGAVISQQGTVKSNTGTVLNLRAVWNTSDSLITDGMVTYAVELYLDYNSLQMRARNGCKLTVGNTTVTFDVPAIQENANVKHSLLIATATYEAAVGEKVSIRANLPYNGVYGGVTIGEIELFSS